jgi:DNA-binding MarR family transcriptional regulator
VLTDPGRRLIDEAIGRHVANEERLLLSLTEVEQETLSGLLKKLIAAL